VISYEFPISEKVRTLLRLEDLFARINYFTAHESGMDHHAALITLLEILEVACRADLKSELLQALERQKRSLSGLHNNPNISEDALKTILGKIDQASADLLSMTGKIGQQLRENEWLMGIKQRTVIPGGTCEFDLPSYHYWQQQEPESRREDLRSWLDPFLPILAGLEIILQLLRENGKMLDLTATQGTFQQMQGGRIAQVIRIRLDRDLPCIPEVSANKYALNIRFIKAGFSAKSTLFEKDVPFELTFFSLA